MKLIKRGNDVYCVEPMKLNIHTDLAELLKLYSHQFDLLPEEIVEYLIDMLRPYKISKEDIKKYNPKDIILVSDEDNSVYKLVKVKNGKNLSK